MRVVRLERTQKGTVITYHLVTDCGILNLKEAQKAKSEGLLCFDGVPRRLRTEIEKVLRDSNPFIPPKREL